MTTLAATIGYLVIVWLIAAVACRIVGRWWNG